MYHTTPVYSRLVPIILRDVPWLLLSTAHWSPLYWEMYHGYFCLQSTGPHYTERCTMATSVYSRLSPLYWQMYNGYSCLQPTSPHYTEKCTMATSAYNRLVPIIIKDVPWLFLSIGDWSPLYWEMYRGYFCLQATGPHYIETCTMDNSVYSRLVPIIPRAVPWLLLPIADWSPLYSEMYHGYFCLQATGRHPFIGLLTQ
jgi:hypothetical protein